MSDATVVPSTHESIWQEFESGVLALAQKAKQGLLALAGAEPVLVEVADIAEAATGNAALIPLTNAAGAALVSASAAASATNIAAAVSGVVQTSAAVKATLDASGASEPEAPVIGHDNPA